MHTPYQSLDQFEKKAALLASELDLDGREALTTLAHLSGYEQPADIAFKVPDRDLLSSREELMARLQAIYPHITHDKAVAVIDKLDLPVRETDMALFSKSPSAAPNISG